MDNKKVLKQRETLFRDIIVLPLVSLFLCLISQRVS